MVVGIVPATAIDFVVVDAVVAAGIAIVVVATAAEGDHASEADPVVAVEVDFVVVSEQYAVGGVDEDDVDDVRGCVRARDDFTRTREDALGCESFGAEYAVAEHAFHVGVKISLGSCDIGFQGVEISIYKDGVDL